jgi:hypothetical protein
VLSRVGSIGKGGVAAGGGATDPAGGAGAPAAEGGSGRDGVIEQLGDVVLGDKQQGSGTGSGGGSWVDLHDQHSRSTRRNLLLVDSRFSSGRGITGSLASIWRYLRPLFELLIGKSSEFLFDSISCILETVLDLLMLKHVPKFSTVLRQIIVLVR